VIVSDTTVDQPDLRQLLAGLTAVRDGDFDTRLPATTKRTSTKVNRDSLVSSPPATWIS